MKKVNNFCLRSFYLVAALCFSYVFLVSLLWNRKQPFILLACVGVFGVAVFFAVARFNDRLQKIADDPLQRRIAFGGTLLVFFCLFLYFGFSLLVDTAQEPWDIWVVHETAKFVANNYKPAQVENIEYFMRHANNEFIMATLAGWFALCKTLVGSRVDYNVCGMLLNTIAATGSLALCYVGASRFFGKKNGLIAAFLWLLFLPLYAYAPVYYTDVLSLPFSCGVFVLLSFVKNNRLWPLPLIGLLLGLGVKMKGTLYILAVAVVIWLVFCKGYKLLRRIAAIGLVCICLLAVTNGFEAFYEKSGYFGEEPTNKQGLQMPLTHWLMMAQSGEGPWVGQDELFTVQIKGDYKYRSDICLQEAINRVKERDLLQNILFAQRRVIAVWGEGTFQSNQYARDYAYHPDSVWFKVMDENGSCYPAFAHACNGFYFAMFGLFLAGLWLRVKQRNTKADALFFIQLALFGMFLFELFWEWRSRYLWAYIPLMIAGSVPVLQQLISMAKQKRNKQ